MINHALIVACIAYIRALECGAGSEKKMKSTAKKKKKLKVEKCYKQNINHTQCKHIWSTWVDCIYMYIDVPGMGRRVEKLQYFFYYDFI